jgi:hypothetical protein
MGRAVFKAAPDVDLYMEWSSFVEAPIFIGTRAEMLEYLTSASPDDYRRTPEERLQWADKIGTTIEHRFKKYPIEGSWEDSGLIVEQKGWLPRERFEEFMRRYVSDPESIYELLDPFED